MFGLVTADTGDPQPDHCLRHSEARQDTNPRDPHRRVKSVDRYDTDVSSLLDLLIHPDHRRPAPPPPVADLRRLAFIGMGIWLVALVVSAALWFTHMADVEAMATCAAGFALGFFGLWWERRHRRDYRPDSPERSL